MRSSSGLYYSRLDHVRAAAAFLVYCWHVVHVQVPFDAVPGFFALSVLEEGHAGVGLFMTLSGYLFAKITDGRAIVLGRFFWNRFVRLAPLLSLVLIYWAVRGRMSIEEFVTGFVQPSWPAGTWSIIAEVHFYALFPLILRLQRTRPVSALVGLLMAAVAIRTAVWLHLGSVQDLAYWTIGGCIDLFLAGMLWHQLAKRTWIRQRAGWILAGAATGFAVFWHGFNLAGGFFGLGGSPSPSPLWIIIPTIEGVCFGAVIVGYENLRVALPARLDAVLAKVGAASYSIYLLHFIVFTALVKALARIGVPMDQLDVALAMAVLTFPAMAVVAIISYELIENPFLALRGIYDRAGPATTVRNRAPENKLADSAVRMVGGERVELPTSSV